MAPHMNHASFQALQDSRKRDFDEIAALKARVVELETALVGAANVPALLTDPKAIQQSAVHHAWAQAVEAERIARAALKREG